MTHIAYSGKVTIMPTQQENCTVPANRRIARRGTTAAKRDTTAAKRGDTAARRSDTNARRGGTTIRDDTITRGNTPAKGNAAASFSKDNSVL